MHLVSPIQSVYNVDIMLDKAFNKLLSGTHRLWRLYVNKVKMSWGQELCILKEKKQDTWWVDFLLSILFAVFFGAYLIWDALSIGDVVLILTFLGWLFVVVSFGFILRSPLLIALVYTVVIVEHAFLVETYKTAMEGQDIIGAIILLVLTIYVIKKLHPIGKGEI